MPTFTFSRKKFAGKVLPLLALSPLQILGNDESIYVVKRGDTLSEIALKFNTSVQEIKRSNGLKSDLIKIGQKLILSADFSPLDPVIKATQKLKVNKSRWKYIVAHHSAIERGNAAAYDRNHRKRGMENGLAYHFVIGNGVDSGDGEIEIGTRWLKQLHGGHVRKHYVNEHGIGICLVGNFEKKRPTKKQLNSLQILIEYLGNDLLSGRYKFNVHKEIDLNHTVCPGKFFPTARMHRKFN